MTRTSAKVTKRNMICSAILVCLAWAATLPAFAAGESETVQRLYLSAATVPTNVAGIHTYAEPPKGFNPVTASDVELATYGFPQRPDKQADPDHYAMWERAMQAAKIRWHGDLKLHPGRSRTKGPAAPSPSSDAVQPQSGPARLSNRQAAGVILNSGAKKWGTSSFNDIWTVISVPVVQVPFANGSCAADGWYYAMSLAGIDGYVWYGGSTGNLSLFEPVEFTGVLEGINCFGGPPFYEAVVGLWDADYGFNGVFSLNPGDLFYTEIHAFGGCNSGSAFVEDLTTLTYNSYSIGNPCLLKQTGTYANWIVARPDFASGGAPDDLSPLGNTIGIFFDGGAVVNGKGQRFYPGSQAASTEILTMTDDASDQSIEIVNQGNTGSQGLSALWFQDTGCAFAGGCTP